MLEEVGGRMEIGGRTRKELEREVTGRKGRKGNEAC